MLDMLANIAMKVFLHQNFLNFIIWNITSLYIIVCLLNLKTKNNSFVRPAQKYFSVVEIWVYIPWGYMEVAGKHWKNIHVKNVISLVLVPEFMPLIALRYMEKLFPNLKAFLARLVICHLGNVSFHGFKSFWVIAFSPWIVIKVR